MLIVGLTGGIGSGKTAVSTLFKNMGVKIIDTDVIAHDLVNNQPSVLKEIVSLFGHDILNKDHSLNRKKLAKIVFSQKKYKQQLEAILHPKIHDEIQKQIQRYSLTTAPEKYIIIVIPLLFETALETEFNKLINRVLVVLADEKIRTHRVEQRDHRTIEDIQSIINTQVSDEQRVKGADDIIENNNNFAALEQQIKQLHDKYLNLATHES